MKKKNRTTKKEYRRTEGKEIRRKLTCWAKSEYDEGWMAGAVRRRVRAKTVAVRRRIGEWEEKELGLRYVSI